MSDYTIRKIALWVGFFLFVSAVIAYVLFSLPPKFPAGRMITIDRGLGLGEVSHHLRDSRVIRFPSIFNMLVYFTRGEGSIKAGDYFFERQLSLLEIYQRVTEGVYGVEPMRVTIFEGWSVDQIGGRFEELGLFSKEEWGEVAESHEGYLFPDTYFFIAGVTPEVVVKTMRENFDQKVDENLRDEISEQGKEFNEIIVMASLIEKEAYNGDDAVVISGILWKRIEVNMGLQVDATLTYITGRPSLKLTREDLAIDSPYNTYRYRGLPPSPITNPGLEAIQAAIFPKKTVYWYYLHGKNGDVHYAQTFEEHKTNKIQYLR